MRTIVKMQQLNISCPCDRCKAHVRSRVVIEDTATGKFEYLCEDCTNADDTLE